MQPFTVTVEILLAAPVDIDGSQVAGAYVVHHLMADDADTAAVKAVEHIQSDSRFAALHVQTGAGPQCRIDRVEQRAPAPGLPEQPGWVFYEPEGWIFQEGHRRHASPRWRAAFPLVAAIALSCVGLIWWACW